MKISHLLLIYLSLNYNTYILVFCNKDNNNYNELNSINQYNDIIYQMDVNSSDINKVEILPFGAIPSIQTLDNSKSKEIHLHSNNISYNDNIQNHLPIDHHKADRVLKMYLENLKKDDKFEDNEYNTKRLEYITKISEYNNKSINVSEIYSNSTSFKNINNFSEIEIDFNLYSSDIEILNYEEVNIDINKSNKINNFFQNIPKIKIEDISDINMKLDNESIKNSQINSNNLNFINTSLEYQHDNCNIKSNISMINNNITNNKDKNIYKNIQSNISITNNNITNNKNKNFYKEIQLNNLMINNNLTYNKNNNIYEEIKSNIFMINNNLIYNKNISEIKVQNDTLSINMLNIKLDNKCIIMDLNKYLLDIFNINKCEFLNNFQNNNNLTINRITEEINIKDNNNSNKIIQIIEENNIQDNNIIQHENNKLDNLSKIEYMINKLNNSNDKIKNIYEKLGDNNIEFENILIESNIKDQNIELHTNKLENNKKINNDIKQLKNKIKDTQITLDEVRNLNKLEILSNNEDPIKLSILPIYLTSSIYYSLYKLLQQFNKYKLDQIYIYLIYEKIFKLDIYKLLQSYIISYCQYLYILLNIYNKLFIKISKWIYSIYYLLLSLPIIVSNPSNNSISGIKIWILSLFITFFIFITKYIFINNKKTIKSYPWKFTEKKIRNLKNILEKNFLQDEQKLIYGKDSYSICEYINNENLLENSNIKHNNKILNSDYSNMGNINLEDIIIRLNECTQIFIHLANGISHKTQILNLNI